MGSDCAYFSGPEKEDNDSDLGDIEQPLDEITDSYMSS